MLAVVDTGANLASLGNALDRLGARWRVTLSPAQVKRAGRVILPGVGAAPPALRRLRETGLDEAIGALRQPVLGICLGLQLLHEATEEGEESCLGVFPGRVRGMAPAPGRPVPHMGWNRLQKPDGAGLLGGVDEGAHVYFVHGFAAPVTRFTVARCRYGEAFSAAVSHGNFHAVQFHPERSGPMGARVLANFLKL